MSGEAVIPTKSLSKTGLDGAHLQSVALMSTTNSEPIDGQVSYDERGLVTCVVQDWASGEVLMLAHMNAQALQRTRETGELHLWSRSRE